MINAKETIPSNDVANEQRQNRIKDLTRMVIKLPNGVTYTVLKPYSADQQR